MNSLKLQGADVLEISAIDHKNDYTKGKRAQDGKTYSRFKFDGVAFTVDTDNPFVQDFIAGQVKQVKLNDTVRDVEESDADGVTTSKSVRSLEFDSYISRAQWKALMQDKVDDAEIDYKVGRYKKLETMPITQDVLDSLIA